MGVTIRDVAKQAGVSATSVSQVLNGREIRISREKRERIYQAARELNYSLDAPSEKNRASRNRMVGLIVPDIRNPYFSEMAKVIIRELKKYGRDVLIADSDNESENDIGNLESFRKKRVEGIILAPSEGESSGIKQGIQRIMERDRIPVVLLDRNNAEYNCHTVMVNHFMGGYLATRYLISLGHRKIGCITGPMNLETAYDRFCGYRSACEEAGIAVNKKLVVHGNYQMESGYKNCASLLEQDVTAIFACNDLMAYGVYNYLNEQKIKIPEEISLIGFDDISFSRLIGMPLTTVHQPVEDIGMRAIQMLLEGTRMREKKSSVFEPYLILRSTTGSPAGERKEEEKIAGQRGKDSEEIAG